MKAGTNALEAVKETSANVAVSARSGLEKTKAIFEEKGDKITARSDTDKAFAEHSKEERKAAAELNKQMAYEQNAVQRSANTAKITTTGGLGNDGNRPPSDSSTGGPGYTAGPPKMSEMPARVTGNDTEHS